MDISTAYTIDESLSNKQESQGDSYGRSTSLDHHGLFGTSSNTNNIDTKNDDENSNRTATTTTERDQVRAMSQPLMSHGTQTSTGNIGTDRMALGSAVLDQVASYLRSPRDGESGHDRWPEHTDTHTTRTVKMDLDRLTHVFLSGDNDQGVRNSGTTLLDHASMTPVDIPDESPGGYLHLDFPGMARAEKSEDDGEEKEKKKDEDGGCDTIAAHDVIRTDLVFSPMMSPVTMPVSGMHNTPFLTGNTGIPHSTPRIHDATSRITSQQPKTSTRSSWKGSTFSPLTSPALTAIEAERYQNQIASSSSCFSLGDAELGSSSSSSSSATTTATGRKGSLTGNRNRRTPHGTPLLSSSSNLGGKNSKKVSKQSPKVCPRRSSGVYRSGSWDDAYFHLPDSSIKDTPPTVHLSNGSSDEPKTMTVERMTPSSMMNYPKVILPSNFTTAIPLKQENVLRATESPVIRPRRSLEQSSILGSNDNNNNNNNNNNNSSSSSLDENSTFIKENVRKGSLSGVYDNDQSTTNHSVDFSNKKNAPLIEEETDEVILQKQKQVHKVAEQGRRNRLNMALKDLESLLPKELRDSVQIPSKAMTVELAAKYIRVLTERLRDHQQE